MARLQTIDPATSTGKAKELLDAVKAKLGLVPNMTKVMANSPAVLGGYLQFSGALAGGTLDPKLREQIALITAQENSCEYCLSAHSMLGKMAGLSDQQLIDSRKGNDSSPKNAAALKFAKEVLDSKGQVSEQQIESVRKAGFSDGEIAEIIAAVALNVLTNYFNIATQVDVDFPKISLAL